MDSGLARACTLLSGSTDVIVASRAGAGADARAGAGAGPGAGSGSGVGMGSGAGAGSGRGASTSAGAGVGAGAGPAGSTAVAGSPRTASPSSSWTASSIAFISAASRVLDLVLGPRSAPSASASSGLGMTKCCGFSITASAGIPSRIRYESESTNFLVLKSKEWTAPGVDSLGPM